MRTNQAGFTPSAPKFCLTLNPSQPTFFVQQGTTNVTWRTVYEGRWLQSPAGQGLWVGDFSAVTEPGDYRILLSTNGCDAFRMPDWRPQLQSYHFPIREGVYDTVERILFGYLLFQRCGDDCGWAGCCHQDLVPLVDKDGRTVRMMDVRGGYHQSCDLRCWHDGVSMSLYALLRFAEVARPCWDRGEIAAEIRRGCDYFLKVLSPEGYVYDAQFTPLGWGPRRYYVAPATLGAQVNVTLLFARASRFYCSRDAAFAERLLVAAKRLWEQIETNPFFAKPRPAPEENLPPGAQPADVCYTRQFRTSAAGLAERAAAALELFRATHDPTLAETAKRLARAHFAAAAKEGAGTFSDWSYCHDVSGRRVAVEFTREFGEAEWRQSLLGQVTNLVGRLKSREMSPRPNPATVSSAHCAAHAVLLTEAAELLHRPDFRPYAQRSLDWVFGANPWNASYVEGVGQNQWQRPVFGQFFPSTPQLPGGVLHIAHGEYDLPATTMMLWACAVRTSAP